jgi:hypothetical protein
MPISKCLHKHAYPFQYANSIQFNPPDWCKIYLKKINWVNQFFVPLVVLGQIAQGACCIKAFVFLKQFFRFFPNLEARKSLGGSVQRQAWHNFL